MRAATVKAEVESDEPVAKPAVLQPIRLYRDRMDALIEDERSRQDFNLGVLGIREFPDLVMPRLQSVRAKATRDLIPLNDRHPHERTVLIEWRYLADYLPQFQPSWDQVDFYRERLSTNPTERASHPQPTPDRMDLYLHVLGFRPQDYQFWDIFSDKPPAGPDTKTQGTSP
jgi:hypothetical protein